MTRATALAFGALVVLVGCGGGDDAGDGGGVDGPPVEAPLLSGAPTQVEERDPLPFCGLSDETFGDVESDVGLAADADAESCFLDRVVDEAPAELIRVIATIDGDTVVLVQRLTGDGEAELYVDATGDRMGSGRWEFRRCAGFDDEGAVDCGEPMLLPFG